MIQWSDNSIGHWCWVIGHSFFNQGPEFGFARSIFSGVLPSMSRLILPLPAEKAPLSLSTVGLGSSCETPTLYFPGGTSRISNLPVALSHSPSLGENAWSGG